MTQETFILETVAQAKAGQHEAFEIIVKNYMGFVYRTALGVVKDPAEADEVAQMTFIRVYRKLGSFRGQSSFRTWLYRVTVNQAKNRLRDRSRHQGIDSDDLPLKADHDPSDEIDRDRQRRALWKELDCLPDVQGNVARLRLAEEMSFAEIAQTLDITENAAKVNFHHAVKKLKERLMR